MEKVIKWQPDVNNSIFRLIYVDGELRKYELEKVDTIHEGMTAEEAFLATQKQCIEKTLTNLEDRIESEKDIEEKAKIEQEIVGLQGFLEDINHTK